jgi:hypothetical protein
MMEILSVINKLLDLKIVQWALLVLATGQLFCLFWSGLKYSTLKTEHAFLQVTAAKLSDGLMVQNLKIKELGERAKFYQEKYVKGVDEAKKVQQETNKSLKAISEYVFDGDCSTNVNSAIELLKGKTK